MNIHVDTLEYANDLQKAGIERAHAEAIAKLQGRTVRELVEHELVTKDYLKSELSQLESKLRDEIRSESTTLRRQMDMQMVQIRALQLGGAIAAFAIGAIVLLARLIR